MTAYKYTTKDGKALWYCSFHYTDWTGEHKRKCKRGFKTKREALEWERDFLGKDAKDPEIRFRVLAEAYMQDQESRLKPTTLHNKQHLIDSKIMPYFENIKIKDIDAIKIRRWQNELVNYKDENGKPFAPTYLRTINTQLSAILNYAVRYYSLPKNHRKTADAGLEQIKIHNLRHSYASMLIQMGVPITEISARLGHESPDITLRTYSHLYPGTKRNASDKISELFDEPDGENRMDL